MHMESCVWGERERDGEGSWGGHRRERRNIVGEAGLEI